MVAATARDRWRTATWRARRGRRARGAGLADPLAVVMAGVALLWLAQAMADAGEGRRPLAMETDGGAREAAVAYRVEVAERVRFRGRETLTAVYSGSPYTYASDLAIKSATSDLRAHAIDWEGRPFEHPIYYGVRHVRWPGIGGLGGMLDFTHSKVYTRPEQRTRFTGTRDGAPLPETSTIGEQFHKLEFTHGHNMLTLNGLFRMALPTAFAAPYVGVGAGVSLPHTEVQLKGDARRTYEYQYTGPAVQAIAGIELRMPGITYFLEYKLTFASYRAPLHNRDGSWVAQDLWHQLRRWLSGAEPEAGWATTRLLSHQVIGGLGYRTAPALGAP